MECLGFVLPYAIRVIGVTLTEFLKRDFAACSATGRSRMLEVPIYFEDRRVGKSKMTTLVKIEAALRVFEIRWRHWNYIPIETITSPHVLKQ